MLLGYQRRKEHEDNRTRILASFVRAFGGMGATEWMPPEQLWPLQMDKENTIQPITTIKQAMQLFKEFN